jgi:hypothetical protein
MLPVIRLYMQRNTYRMKYFKISISSISKLYPDPHRSAAVSGSGYRRAKRPIKNGKGKKFEFCSAGCSLLKAEGFSCSLDVLRENLGRSKLKFLNKKIINLFFICKFCSILCQQNPGSGLRIRIETNADPYFLWPLC